MDAAGIRVSLVSFAPVGLIDDPNGRADLCRAANDGLLQLCADYPDRFVMAAMLPLPDVDAAYAELERIRHEDDLRAIQIVAQTTLYKPDEIGLEPLFRMAAEGGIPLLLHPSAGVADLSPAFESFGLSSGMHAMISHALVAARIIQSGMMDRIDNLQMIVTHLGGVLPFLIDRIDSRNTGPTRHPPSHYLHSRVFVDNCGYPAGPALRCALETLGAERIMIGSDWPSRPIDPVIEAIRGLGLDSDSEQAIFASNAARWFEPHGPRIGR
jgi:6-methylsalicylate decarboxylase